MLAAVASACSSPAVYDVTPSPTATAAIPTARPGTIAPITSPGPVTSASGAPIGSTGAAVDAVPTPRPALSLPLVSGTCSEWPADVATVQTQLSLPPSLCFMRATPEQREHLICTVVGCVPLSTGCVDQGYCILAVEGLSAHYVLAFIRPPEGLPPPVAETATITRSLCRLHQLRTLLDAVVPGEPLPAEGWLATLEARDFETAFSQFRATYPADALRWEPKASAEENYADVCAAWYYPPARAQKVSDYTPLASWATKWLPR